MYYYKLDIIPIILKRFKVDNVVISGLDDKSTVEIVLKYCDINDVPYTAIDSKNTFSNNFIQDYTLNVLPNLSNYGAIFINDDPNWFTVYNELNVIKQNNDEFPLVFVCNNVFPHKRRDSYIDPEIIPENFRNDFSNKFDYKNIYLSDDFYHAIEENTPQNGVFTAIEDFLAENQSIGVMNIKFANGITVLYPKNNISKIRLGRLSEEIQGYGLEFDEISDSIIENQLLTSYVSKLNISNENLDIIENIKFELDKKERIINEYEEKIQLLGDELNYKNSQIESIDSKLSLKDGQIKNFESKLVNKDNEVNNLNSKLQDIIGQVNSLKNEFHHENKNFENKERDLNEKINEANLKINSLKNNISQKEQIEGKLNNQLEIANNQIKKNIEQLNYKDKYIFDKDNEILIKEEELKDKEKMLDLMKQRHINQLSSLDNKEYCISCYKEEISNVRSEVQYLKKDTLIRKFFSPFAYLYLIVKSNPEELSLNLKLYKALKNSHCFDIGFYLNNNKDLFESKWCKFFSPELHYICKGFGEKRVFNKKYFNTNSKKELLDYVLNCP